MDTTSSDRRERIRARVEEKLRPLTLPNFLTLLRMAIVPFFVLAVFAHEFQAGGVDLRHLRIHRCA